MSKIQFRELFTTLWGYATYPSTLCEICQRYNFESYSQPKNASYFTEDSCVRYVKDTISRAIHNVKLVGGVVLRLCEICQRYNFESYSQQRRLGDWLRGGCVRYVKDTISRAIHNEITAFTLVITLCEICQRYNFESYSQRMRMPSKPGTRCVRYVKDTISRAIHNCGTF